MVASVVAFLVSTGAAERHLLVLAGQSNMVGTASVEDAPPLDSVPGVLVWNQIGSHSGTWTTLVPGLSADSTTFGPEVSLIHRLVGVLPRDTFAVLKVAAGASTLEGRWRSPSSGDTVGDLYQVLLEAARLSRESHPLGEFPFSGFFWMQGESDAQNETSAKLYRERLEAFLVDLRREWSDTSMPWILGMIDVQPAWPWADLVREGTSEAAEALERVSLVETVGLPTDGIHYTAVGIKRLGVLFADRWLLEKGLVPSGTSLDAPEVRWVGGGRLLVASTGQDPIQEARMVSVEGRCGPWTSFRHSVVLTGPPGGSEMRRGISILQVRRRSGRSQSLRVAWR